MTGYTESECYICEMTDVEFDCHDCGRTCCASCEGDETGEGDRLCFYCADNQG